MIAWIKSAEMNNCTVEWLKGRFVKYPSSAKKVIRICDMCGEERELYFHSYHDLCQSCARIKFYENPEHRKDQSIIKTIYYKDPKHREEASKSRIEYFKDPKNGENHSKLLIEYHKNHPGVISAQHESQRGGNDILKHHFIYDHNNPDQHTVEITRSEHTSHHWWMKRNGLEVPHYNVTEDNKDIFKCRRYKYGSI